MSIKTRLVLLLTTIALVFGTFFILTYLKWKEEARTFLSEIEKEKLSQLAYVEDLLSSDLVTKTKDYSWWDEMVAFIKSRDPEWGREHIDETLNTVFHSHAAWIYSPDWNLVYSTDIFTNVKMQPLEIDPEILKKLFEKEMFPQFFMPYEDDILLMRGAPINPQNAERSVIDGKGYLFVGMILDDVYRSKLEGLAQCELRLLESIEFQDVENRLGDGNEIDRFQSFIRFNDPHGDVFAILEVTYEAPVFAKVLMFAEKIAGVFFIFTIVTLFLLTFFISRWVLSPFRSISHALKTGNPDPIRHLVQGRGEFGHISELIASFFSQQEQLEKEVESRKETEKELRSSVDERAKLQRDLHDGAIQSIYAVGLRLENAVHVFRDKPDSLGKELDLARKGLNGIIRDLRGFLNGQESEILRETNLDQALENLVGSFRKTYSCDYELRIEEGLIVRLNRKQTINIFHIAQELIVNAIRHAGPNRIGLVLGLAVDVTGEKCRLVVENDGKAFNPGGRTFKGMGLKNLKTRAEEIEAEFSMTSLKEGLTSATLLVPLQDSNGSNA